METGPSQYPIKRRQHTHQTHHFVCIAQFHLISRAPVFACRAICLHTRGFVFRESAASAEATVEGQLASPDVGSFLGVARIAPRSKEKKNGRISAKYRTRLEWQIDRPSHVWQSGTCSFHRNRLFHADMTMEC